MVKTNMLPEREPGLLKVNAAIAIGKPGPLNSTVDAEAGIVDILNAFLLMLQ